MNVITFDSSWLSETARAWLEERDPSVGSGTRRHVQLTKDGEVVLIEGPASQIDTVRPNFKTHCGYFRHEYERKASTWKYVYSVTERYKSSYSYRRYSPAKYQFFIEDDYLAIEFKLCTSER